jgi:CheY-specific phosphatase CheX
MNLDVAGEMERVACEVLERFALVFADPAVWEDDGQGEEALCAVVGFTGGARGKLTILTALATASELAASALGVEGAAADAAAPDTLQELANQVCGQLLTTLAGEHAAIDLGIPICGKADPDLWQEMAGHEGSICLLVDGMSPLIVEMEYTPEAGGTEL